MTRRIRHLIRRILDRSGRGTGLGLEGHVTILAHDEHGNLIERRTMKNDIVDDGRQLVRDLLGGTGFRPDVVKAGDSNASTTSGMSDLQGANVETLQVSRRVQQTYGIDFQAVMDGGVGNGIDYEEIGTFESSSGRMLGRAIISPAFSKTSGVTVTFIHSFTVQAV